MKTIKQLGYGLLLSALTVLLTACPGIGTSEPPPYIRVVKFTKTEYKDYVLRNVHASRPEIFKVWSPPEEPKNWTDYFSGRVEIQSIDEFDAHNFYYPLHDGYYLCYPYEICGTTMYNVKWTELTSLDIDWDAYGLYNYIISTPYEVSLTVKPPKTVKDVDGVIKYLNDLIDKGKLLSDKHVEL